MTQMHENEVLTDADQVARLVAAQFPQWAELPVRRVPSSGTDNALYRLGDELVVRLPRIEWAVGQVAKEQEWLPRLAPQLPLDIPVPLAVGMPGEGYPWHWSIYRWLNGRMALSDALDDPCEAAIQLAEFIVALHAIDPTGGPVPGGTNSDRGAPLAWRDKGVRVAIGQLAREYDTAALTAAWESALDAQVWDRPGVWIHGDLQDSNLLATDGRLSAVIDFGCLGVGDPACDVMIAWKMFAGVARGVFREHLQVDEATWLRGRGWALSTGLLAVPYYDQTNPAMAESGRHSIEEVLADVDVGRDGR